MNNIIRNSPQHILRRNYLMIAEKIASELEIKPWQTEATIKLMDEENTIPFISRYRKETTGSLDDEILRKFRERL
jgi:uncharacterized protein